MKGLDRFREHFRTFGDRYVILGGTACLLAMREVGADFRATKDIDLMLSIEALDAEFAAAFWEFVDLGGYASRERASGRRELYRFVKPQDGFPQMLEIFSRKPDLLRPVGEGQLTPIPVDDEIESLSAILLDDDYYEWTRSGRTVIDGLSIARAEHLIPLKARAWLDLRARLAAGEQVDKQDVKKHRNDVFRLYGIIDPGYRAALPESIRGDMARFLEAVRGENVDLKHLGLPGVQIDAACDVMVGWYLG